MKESMTLEDTYVLPTYEKFPFALERGEGCYVWDENGNKYLDLYGGHAVAALGHSPREISDAIAAQSKKLLFYSNLVYNRARAEAAKALVEFCGEEGSQVFFCNSGAEANENALRIARSVTGRAKVVAAEGGFHGRTAAAVAATGAKYRKGLSGLGSDIVHVAFGDLPAAEAAIDGNTAAFLLEPIQSVQGAATATSDYLKGLQLLCERHGALLIYDEVQTGLGRVGARSARHAWGARPHMQTFAKALASGVPAGAVLAVPEVAKKVKPGALGSTFGGGPLASVAITATLKAITDQKLWVNAAAMEALIRETFQFPQIVEIRGKGLLLGIVLDRPSKATRASLLAKNILVGGADDPNVIRLLPPLTVGAAEIKMLRDALAEIFAQEQPLAPTVAR
ncbi:MAG: aminotransferase class III-fold pyridoxal phosphate-dependent enzyme [Elusimicrobia bacterium]|nr:aminotransferase class III-fold pyridoxal phosphate-dependent enzyme [Elusimicrobiota bacterium]